jgi:hypothetical protein
MLHRMTGPILTGAGVLILAASLLADVIWRFPIGQSLGFGHNPGVGLRQTAGTIIGVALLMFGIWFWRRGAKAKYASVRYAIAALVLAVVIGAPVVTNRYLRQAAAVEVCVEVETVPSSAGGAGQKRVTYGVRIVNTGRSRLQVDSVVLVALSDSAESWLSRPDVVAITDMTLWQQVDSVTKRPTHPGQWSVSTGDEFLRMRSIFVPVAELRPLYLFRGFVFLRHRGPRRAIGAASARNWIDNFQPGEDGRAGTLTPMCGT